MPDESTADSDQAATKPESALDNLSVSEKTDGSAPDSQTNLASDTNKQDAAKAEEPKAEAVEPVKKPETNSEENAPVADKKDEVKSKSNASSSSLSQTEADSLETEQVVVFKLETEEYAAPILDVQEIIPTGVITPFPNVPEYISGIINVRGTVATVINLAKKFNLSRKAEGEIDRYIILTTVNKSLYGITVDDVTSVMKIPTNKIKSAAGVSESKIKNEYVNNVAVIDDRVILILDFKKILDEEAVAAVASQAESVK